MQPLVNFLYETSYATKSAEIYSQLEELAKNEGYDWVAINAGLGADTANAYSNRQFPATRTNYPKEWLDYYSKNSLTQFDPVLALYARYNSPISWEKLKRNHHLTPSQKKIFKLARGHDIVDGISVPVFGPFSHSTVITFSTSKKIKNVINLSWLKLVATQTYNRICDIAGYFDNQLPFDLTDRQRECLKWVAKGKSSWEIASILEISPNTVDYHMKIILEKFDVASRIEAVLMASRFGILPE